MGLKSGLYLILDKNIIVDFIKYVLKLLKYLKCTYAIFSSFLVVFYKISSFLVVIPELGKLFKTSA